jgi:hypothetical protein
MSLDSQSKPEPSTQGTADLQQIARELAALGELEASEEELALLGQGRGELPVSDDERLVGELFRIAEASSEDEVLDELAARRVYRHVESAEDASGPSKRRGVPGVLIGLLFAAAAALVLVFVPPAETAGPSRDSAELGAVAHASLEALGVDTSPGADAKRTKALARALERTLEEPG